METHLKNCEEDFDKQFVQDNGPDIESSFKDPNGSVGPIKQFIHSTRQSAAKEAREEVLREIEKYMLELMKGDWYRCDSFAALKKIFDLLQKLTTN